MALKDWEVISNLKYIKRWQNFESNLSLVMAMDSIPENGWIVYNWKLPARRFKTKKQALKYAKKYMREH